MFFLTHWLLIVNSFHALYLSTASLKVHSDLKKIEVQLKIFSDDLQTALINHNREDEIFSLEELGQKNRFQIERYFNKHLKLTLEKHNTLYKMQLEEINADYQGEVYLINAVFRTKNQQLFNANKLKIQADYLMEIFPTQSNVLAVYKGTNKYFLRFNKNKTKDSIDLLVE